MLPHAVCQFRSQCQLTTLDSRCPAEYCNTPLFGRLPEIPGVCHFRHPQINSSRIGYRFDSFLNLLDFLLDLPRSSYLLDSFCERPQNSSRLSNEANRSTSRVAASRLQKERLLLVET
jgi:hypothetical protein